MYYGIKFSFISALPFQSKPFIHFIFQSKTIFHQEIEGIVKLTHTTRPTAATSAFTHLHTNLFLKLFFLYKLMSLVLYWCEVVCESSNHPVVYFLLLFKRLKKFNEGLRKKKRSADAADRKPAAFFLHKRETKLGNFLGLNRTFFSTLLLQSGITYYYSFL